MVDAGTVAPEEPDPHTPPTTHQLRLVFVHQSLPFVGFGFLDNLIMILAGEYLDVTIGVTLGISVRSDVVTPEAKIVNNLFASDYGSRRTGKCIV